MIFFNKSKTTASKPLSAPVITNDSWRFADLSAAKLLPLLQQHLSAQDSNIQWQLIWLNNDGKSVIGLLPKVSWTVYFQSEQDYFASTLTTPAKDRVTLYKVVKTCRDKQTLTSTCSSYAEWQAELIDYCTVHNNDSSKENSVPQTDNQPKYDHGLMGFIGYDIAAHELSPTAEILQASQPCAALGHYDIYLTPANNTINNENSWQLNIQSSDSCPNSDNQNKNSLLSKLISYLDSLDNEISKDIITNKTALIKSFKLTPLALTAQWYRTDYQQAFAKTQHYLQQGDCYQINLTQAWQGYLTKADVSEACKLLDYLPTLHGNTNAPFAGYLELRTLREEHSNNNDIKSKHLHETDFELLSCSPELFFTFIKNHKTGIRQIITKPIKGTMPRGNNAEQDVALKQQLIASDKDRAENVMIVDLLRNDLGKYAKTGSVKVPQLFAIESFSNVHHMVSTISAELKADVHPLAVLFGSLPAGSITGTPKNRAVEVIAELEGTARGAYCGTMGYMNFDGSGQWNVLIRTLQASRNADNKKQMSLWAGGGITIASDCDAEYQECLDKVGNLLEVLKQPNY